MIRNPRPAAVLLATTALAIGLCACKPDRRAEPVVAGAPPIGPLDPGAAAYAPALAAPAPAPAPEGEAQFPAYAYPQRAYAIGRVADQRPPSSAFGYGAEQPWVWDDGADGTMFAEPIDDGYRYYYYEPGADYPYFVQDPDYGYAYGPDGALVALFGVTGALIAADHWGDHGPRAARYWSRGYDLDRAYRYGSRIPVQPAIWRARAPAFRAGHDHWFHAAQAQPAWRQAGAWGRGAGHGDGGHDNGRHLGRFNDHGGYGAGRQVAFAAPNPRVHPQEIRLETGQPRRHQGWARPDRPAGQTPGPQWRGQQRPRPGPGPAPGQGQAGWNHGGGGHNVAHAAPQPHGGGGPHGGWNHGGGQAFVHAAPQAHGGGGQHGGWNHGGTPGGGSHGGGPAFAHAAQAHGANAGWHGGRGGGGGGGHGPAGGAPNGGGQGHGGGDGNHGGGGGNHGGGGHGHDH